MLELDASKYRIIGVMQAGFNYPFRTQLWVPMDMSEKGLGQRGGGSYNAIGRMKPGVTVEKARADVSLIAAQLERAYPKSNYKVGAIVIPLQSELVGGARNSLLMMLAAVGLVLLIACVNVANLLLSRAMARQKEMAVRSALGASRSRILRQLLTESLFLSFFGGALGLLLGWWLIDMVPKIESFSLPDFNPIQLNSSVLAFTFVLAVATGVLFGLAPALQTARRDPHEELKGGAGSVLSPSRHRRLLMNALVAGEIALSMLLLIPTGLLLKDFVRVRSVDIGVRRDGIWTGSIHLPEATYKTVPQRDGFAQRLLEQARRIPGVKTASLSDLLPLEGGNNYYIRVRGRVTKLMSGPLVENHAITPEYFHAIGIPLLKGRLFTAADVQRTMNLDVLWMEAFKNGQDLPAEKLNLMVYPTVVNETMVRTFWPGENPLGKMFARGDGGDGGPWRQVIGVVGDVRQHGILEKPWPEAYDAMNASGGFFLHLHTSVPPGNITPVVQRALAKIDSSLALARTRTMEDVVADNVSSQRFLSSLAGCFAAIAALLAAIGIYGVLSYVVTQRTREIGIRISLGATRMRVLSEFLREGMGMALAGFAAGIAGAFAAGRIMESLLHDVRSSDPSVFVAATALLALVTFLACLFPAHRATKLDPARALRQE
jgi:putative ABC transport system permease protein